MSNSQISQLIKDLIRNDAKMKSSMGKYARDKLTDNYERYLKTGNYDFEEDEFEEEKKSQNGIKNLMKFIRICMMNVGIAFCLIEVLNFWKIQNSKRKRWEHNS